MYEYCDRSHSSKWIFLRYYHDAMFDRIFCSSVGHVTWSNIMRFTDCDQPRTTGTRTSQPNIKPKGFPAQWRDTRTNKLKMGSFLSFPPKNLLKGCCNASTPFGAQAQHCNQGSERSRRQVHAIPCHPPNCRCGCSLKTPRTLRYEDWNDATIQTRPMHCSSV